MSVAIETTIVIPQRNDGEILRAQVPEVYRWLAGRGESFELLVIDDCSVDSTRETLLELMDEYEHMRVVRLNRPAGISAALTVAFQEARGGRIAALSAGSSYSLQLMDNVLNDLCRADMAVGRPKRSGAGKLLHRIARIPRWALLGLQVRDPECLFWACRREVVVGVELARGMYRYLTTYVSMRGYRVAEVSLDETRRTHRTGLRDSWPNPMDLLTVWWTQRRWPQFASVPLTRSSQDSSVETIRIDRPHVAMPTDVEQKKSA
ncbi:MAG: dolichol-phosphate mannosyltransferase [Pirellulaceae bacterium]|jgi:dolichol-phosphate mannosyltransferase